MTDEPKWQQEILAAANKQTLERLAAPPDSLDLKYNPKPICPKCGKVTHDPGDMTFGGEMEGEEEVECGACGAEFVITREVEITYSTALK